MNPTDRATPSKANAFSCNDIWLKESEIFLSSRDLVQETASPQLVQEIPQLVQPEDEKEVRPDTLVKATKICVTDISSIEYLRGIAL